MPKKIPAFISYAHQDSKFLEELLACLNDDTHLELWYDKKIRPGSFWNTEILKQLDRADIVMLLISNNSLSSQYINEKEIKRTLQRDNCAKVGIYISPVNTASNSLGAFQALPPDLKYPISSYPDKNVAWTAVRLGIEKVISDTRESYQRVAEERIGRLQKTTKIVLQAIILFIVAIGLFILLGDYFPKSLFLNILSLVLINGGILAFIFHKRIQGS